MLRLFVYIQGLKGEDGEFGPMGLPVSHLVCSVHVCVTDCRQCDVHWAIYSVCV